MIRLFKHYVPYAVLLIGLIDFALLMGAAEAAWRVYAWQIGMDVTPIASRVPQILTFAAALSAAMVAVGAYGVEALQSIKFAMARLLVAISLGVILISVLAFLFPGSTLWRGNSMYAMAISAALLIVVRMLLGTLLGGDSFRRRVLVLGAGPRARRPRRRAADARVRTRGRNPLAGGERQRMEGDRRRARGGGAEPRCPEAHLLAGDASMLNRFGRAAAAEFRRAANLAFTEPTALRLVEALQFDGRGAEAALVLELFLEQNPRRLAAERLRGNIRMSAGDWAGAAESLAGVRARTGDHDPVLLNNQAWARFESGEGGVALGDAATAHRLFPVTPPPPTPTGGCF